MIIWWIQLACIVHSTVNGYWYEDYAEEYSKCKPEEKKPFSYSGIKNGPEKWGKLFPTCDGYKQSPIAIVTDFVIPDEDLEKLIFKKYDVPITKATIKNTGFTVEVTPEDDVDRVIFVKEEPYKLEQLHFHWGDNYKHGSEHVVDEWHYSMELHLVHRSKKGEIAVVAVFFQEKEKMKNEELDSIIRYFPKVLFEDSEITKRTKIVLEHLLPENPASFFRYTGSLTTPGCDEDVTWSVLVDAVAVGHKQMKEFRKLYSVKESDASKYCKLSNNYRPLQDLNKRKVFVSH